MHLAVADGAEVGGVDAAVDGRGRAAQHARQAERRVGRHGKSRGRRGRAGLPGAAGATGAAVSWELPAAARTSPLACRCSRWRARGPGYWNRTGSPTRQDYEPSPGRPAALVRRPGRPPRALMGCPAPPMPLARAGGLRGCQASETRFSARTCGPRGALAGYCTVCVARAVSAPAAGGGPALRAWLVEAAPAGLAVYDASSTRAVRGAACAGLARRLLHTGQGPLYCQLTARERQIAGAPRWEALGNLPGRGQGPSRGADPTGGRLAGAAAPPSRPSAPASPPARRASCNP